MMRQAKYKKGSSDYKKNNHKPYIDPAKLAGLSYEERMKLYKDAYGKNDGYKKDSYKKNGYNKNAQNKGGYNKDGYNKGNYNKNNYNKKPYNKGAPQNKPAATEKKSFWQKVKSFFGR